MRIYRAVLRILLILAATSFILLGTLAFFQHWQIAGTMLIIFVLLSIIALDIIFIQKAFGAKNEVLSGRDL